ncbi:unnamed protein product [Caenorhabditis bovis]|uniref:CYtochrome P450 family n=1 Tax=Caenorhabditis bovis TaxID=2654633 RepID=A0A8S1E533_9PELO|nr:unnamed protein product [Caenorhabditis bovis]
MLLILILLLIAFFALVHQKQKRVPKGPPPLPIIGNLHQIAYYSWKLGGIVEAYQALQSEYGKVFTVWIGPLPTVNIASYQVAYETHVKQANTFGHRFSTGVIQYLREGRGIIASNGDFWQEHRRFALHTLRNFGVGRNLMECKILDELDYRCSEFEGVEFKASTFFDLLIGSIINQLLISERFEKNDEEFEELKNSIEMTLKNLSLLEFFAPVWLLKSWPFNSRTQHVFTPFDTVYAIARKNISKRVKEIECGDHVISEDGDDFLDAYLYKIQCDKESGIANSTFNLDTLAIDVYDLWIAGQETTSTTLTWGFLCLLKHPEVVEKIRAELNKTTSNGSRNLSLSDKPNTPYLVATINEIQRIASILNLNLLRVMQEDSDIDGQPISKGTVFCTQMSVIHQDETIFKNPKEFNPSRFIEDETLEKMLIPFGIGKRVCLGESLARAELYLIIGNLILRYNIENIGELPRLETTSPFGMVKRPPAYVMRMTPVQ